MPQKRTITTTTDYPHVGATTPTLCGLLGIAPPTVNTSAPLENVVSEGLKTFGTGSAQRCLIYCPDAIGHYLLNVYTSVLDSFHRWAPHRVILSAPFPPKTPISFATMFTGAPPAVHGITRPVRPVLACDTLFDACGRVGLRVAVVTVTGSSVDLIFRGRPLDYFSERYDDEVLIKATKVIAECGHDVVVVYQQEYDDVLHRDTPFSAEALAAAARHAAAFSELAALADVAWRSYNHVRVFAPDHGAHVDAATGRGYHGDDVPEDILVSHFYGFRAAAAA